MRHLVFGLFLLFVTASGLSAQSPAPQPAGPANEPDATRQLGAHAHGQGRLNIALEGKTVEMELEAPGADIVGFEHAATTAEQKAAIAKARASLAKPMALFKMTPQAGCKAGDGKVKLIGGEAHQGHGHGHAHGKTSAAKTGTSQSKDPASHSEFHVEYRYICGRIDALRSIEFEYFKAFPGAMELEVTIIGPKGQTKQKVGRDKPRLEFAAGS